MSIMAKTPSGYKKIGSAYLGERPVDKVFNANGDVVYALQRELTGVPPLLFKGKEQSELLNYRIYGDTVDGESVGDRTGNLFDKSGSQYGNNLHWVPTRGLVYSDTYYGSPIMDVTGLNTITRSYTGTSANYFLTSDLSQFVNVSNVGTVDAGATVNVPDGYTKYVFNIPNTIRPDSIMVNSGSTPLPYEPYGYKVPVTVEGKNLFSSRIEQGSFDGITGVPNNSSTRVRSHEDDYIFLTPGVYKISAMGVEHLVVYAYDLPDVNAFNYNLSRTNWAPLPSTITINTSAYYKFGFCKTNNPNVTPSDISNIMLNTGSDALPYEPYHTPVTTPIYLPEPIKMVGDEAEYIDYAEQKQHRVRKNLLENTATNQTINGVTFTVNSDGSVTCDGTASNAIYFSFAANLESGTYIISGTPRGMTEKNAVIFINANYSTIGLSNNVIDNDGNGKQFVATQSGTATLTITIKSGYTCNNLTFHPMIRKADIEDDTYEPYIENTDVDATLPTLPTLTGTNVLSVGTAVQPSRMDIKGRIKSLT